MYNIASEVFQKKKGRMTNINKRPINISTHDLNPFKYFEAYICLPQKKDITYEYVF